MSNIPIKSASDDSGAFYPESHERAITDDNGTTLESKLQMLQNPIFTLNSAPTSSTLTHTEGGVTYTFKVGDEVRVHDTEKGTAEGNYYVFYTLKDKSNGTAYWEESGSGGGISINTYSVLIDSNQSDKSDIANTKVTYNTLEYGSGATIIVPSSTTINVSDLTVSSITGYSVDVQVSGWNIIVTYSTEILTVTITATDEVSGVSSCSVTVTDGNDTTLGTLTNGQSLKVPYGVNYICTPSIAPAHYFAPVVITKDWSDTTTKALTFTYLCEYIDLGLPSGLKWAIGNLVKDSNGNYAIGEETDYGTYTQWGDVVGHNKGEGYKFSSSNYSSTPGKNVSADIPSNDAAHDIALATLGSPWHLPTKADFKELKDNTDSEWVADYNGTGVAGRKFMKKTDHSVYVFFPASGFYDGMTFSSRGSYGYYWSSSFYNSESAYSLYFSSSSASPQDYCYRRNGLTVRAVR